MKRNGKWIALAAALALCLALTGCYVAPDDTNNAGATNAGNNLPFLTLQPTATVTMTPDTVVVETPGTNQGQQIFPTQPTATPTPANSGNNGWNDWGNGNTANPGALTPIPTSGTIVFDNTTPVPGAENTIIVVTGSPTIAAPTTPAQPTPTPTPQSMRLGFQGDSVRSVQRRLKELGFYNGAIDGDFGEATDRAVRAFQKANGLSADGKVGEMTLKKLNDKNAKTAKQAGVTADGKPTAKVTAKPTAKPTPKPTATPNLQKDYYLRLGSSGKKVETLQRRLIELGWLGGKVTGEFDAATEAAVRAFQEKTKGIWTDGIAGPDTLRALYSSSAARSKSPAATNSAETLEYGSEGAAVTKLQKRLQDLGYLAGSADGKFGVATQAAVIAFQKNNNLTADGKAGVATQSKLYSSGANRASGNAANIDRNSGGRDTKDIASTGYETLEFGSEGDAVRKLQNRLEKLGYTPGYTDGKYGTNTEAAVMAFQANNNLTVDGKAGPATQRKLYGTDARSMSYSTLRPDDRGEAVRNLQYTLYELGYYDGRIDGIYGQTTSDAVRSFQIENKLTPVDGIAGKNTLTKLYSSSAIPASQAGDLYETVSYGDTGEVVVEIQGCLVDFGYLTAVTGVYDEDTVAAVTSFQRANGLKADGICGSETLKVLFGY